MIEQKYIDLINADLDGELTADERADLDEFLANSSEGRRLRAELADVIATMVQVPDPETPADLRVAIVDAIPNRLVLRHRGYTRWWKPAAALAASVVFAVTLSVVMEPMGVDDMGPVTGTLAPAATAESRQRVERPEFSADLTYGWRGGSFVVEMALESSDSITTTVEYPQDLFEVTATDGLQPIRGNLTLSVVGSAQATATLRTRSGIPQDATEVRLTFHDGARLIHTETLEVRPPGPVRKD